MSPLTIGGKVPGEVKPRVLPLPTVDTRIDTAWGPVNTDPFLSPSQPIPERVSWLADAGVWAQQFVAECAALARKLDRLKQKLNNPDLDASPSRPAALDRRMRMEEAIASQVRGIAWHEADASRVWESLSPEDRIPVAGHWHTPPDEETLIGWSWVGIGSFETWPVGFRIQRQWFQGWPWVLITDMQEAGVFEWDPNPRPPFPPEEGFEQ